MLQKKIAKNLINVYKELALVLSLFIKILAYLKDIDFNMPLIIQLTISNLIFNQKCNNHTITKSNNIRNPKKRTLL